MHEQIFAFQQNHSNSCDILFVFDVTSHSISLTQLDSIEAADCDDYVNYSTALLDDDDEVELTDLIETRFAMGETPSTSSSNFDYMYLLIKI